MKPNKVLRISLRYSYEINEEPIQVKMLINHGIAKGQKDKIF